MANAQRITSLKNPLIQRMKALKDREARLAQRLFLVEGPVMLREALTCGLTPACFFYDEEKPDPALLAAMAGAGASLYAVPRQVLEAICPTKTPQGACGAFQLVESKPLAALGPLLVALDGVQDPGNAGTIWRTADAAGFDGLLLGAGCADPLGPKVQRAAMGSGFRLPFCQLDDLAAALKALRDQGWQVVVSALDGDDIYRRAPLGQRFVLVIGSEAHGASPAVKAQATHRVKLPMRGGAESLNAAVAAGVLMYELTRTLPSCASC